MCKPDLVYDADFRDIEMFIIDDIFWIIMFIFIILF